MELNNTLNEASEVLRISLKDNNVVNVQKVKENREEKSTDELELDNNSIDKNVIVINANGQKELAENTKKEKVKMVLRSAYRVGEEFLDSVARKYLKKRYKLNFSVYNDGKDAVKSVMLKDYKTFLKKGTDSILYAIKKIPSDTKKVIKNTKNKAIDEVFSWSGK